MKKITITATSLCLAGLLAWFVVDHIRTPKIRNIVLISMDTTRADHLSCYGYLQQTTPHIDKVAGHATRFTSAISPAPFTLPAHCSMLTGKIPPAHGVHHNVGYQLAPSNITLAEILKTEGFETAGFIGSFALHSTFNIHQGFDSFNDEFRSRNLHAHLPERYGDETTQLALDWLDSNKNKRKSFLFLHYYDPHDGYSPPEPYATQFANNLYAGEIAFTDRCIGRVIQKLKDLKLYDSTLLIITADHGEMLGEHGEKTHTYFIYESAIKVPLIVKLPGQKTALTVSKSVGLVDIVPTICSLLGIAPPENIQGSDLSGFLKGETPDDYKRYFYSESVAPTRFGASSLMAVSSDRWKYIQAPRPELYDVINDRWETNNLVGKEHQRARILEDKLREILERSVQTNVETQIEMDPKALKKLESLGYVAGREKGGIVFDETKYDPKDFVYLIEVMKNIRRMTERGEFGKARKILEEIASQVPNCTGVFSRLGEIGIEQNDYECAVVNYRRVHQLHPESIPDHIYNNLAWVQATRPSLPSKDVHEAVLYAKKSCQRTDYKNPGALDTLATAYAAAGDFSKAVETAQKALASAGNNAPLSREITKRLELFNQNKPYIEE